MLNDLFLRKGLAHLLMIVVALSAIAVVANKAVAQDETPTVTEAAETTDAAEATDEAPADADKGVGYALENIMLFVAAVLVFFMQAGFAMVEAGFNASKNAVNILFKNSMDIAIGVLLFFIFGFGLMYPGLYKGADPSPYFGFGGFGLDKYDTVANTQFSPEVDWLFQAMFCATAATIVSGAVAGRMRVSGYLIYSAVITGLIYPISGYWKWGGGWLDQMGFQDFAGSAVVHGVGGFAGLAGAIVLGPRIGRFVSGKSIPMPGHSLPIAALGVFILWFGWYGFNPGSNLAFQGTGDVNLTMHAAVTTTLAAGAGGLTATLLSWFMFGKPDLSMGLNGILGGLVGITACCDCMTDWMAIVVGLVAGVLIILGVMLLDKLKIDDPVGAWPVHGLCGIWGCMAIGILPNAHTSAAVAEKLLGTNPAEFEAATSFGIQLTGTAVICAWSFVTMLALFSIMKVAGILRVSEADELKGLDISEHGMKAYGIQTS